MGAGSGPHCARIDPFWRLDGSESEALSRANKCYHVAFRLPLSGPSPLPPGAGFGPVCLREPSPLVKTGDPIFLGMGAFLLWTALSVCCFLLATGAARLICGRGRNIYDARLMMMCWILLLWWFCVPLTARAYIGNTADPRDAGRHARWEAREAARRYGAHTIWPWLVIALLHPPKPKSSGDRLS